MEATLEIATHFRDGTNLVGAEIAPELNYLWIVYWSKNRTPLGKFESYREDSLIRLLSNTWQLIFTCFTWHYEEKTLDSQNSEGTCYAIITSNVHTDRCAVFWQPRTFTVRSDVHRQVDNLRAVAKKKHFLTPQAPKFRCIGHQRWDQSFDGEMLHNMAPLKVIQFLSPFFGSYLTHAKIQRRLRSRKERFQFIREGNYVFFNVCWIYKRKPVYEEPFCSRTPFSAETARENPRETFAKFSSLVSFFLLVDIAKCVGKGAKPHLFYIICWHVH